MVPNRIEMVQKSWNRGKEKDIKYENVWTKFYEIIFKSKISVLEIFSFGANADFTSIDCYKNHKANVINILNDAVHNLNDLNKVIQILKGLGDGNVLQWINK